MLLDVVVDLRGALGGKSLDELVHRFGSVPVAIVDGSRPCHRASIADNSAHDHASFPPMIFEVAQGLTSASVRRAGLTACMTNMSRSLGQHAQSRKGKNAPQTCPPPGPKLWSLIEIAARNRPVYRVAGGILVPRLTWTAEATHYDIEPESVGIRADVAAHLDGECAGAQRASSSTRSRLQLARLTAAAYRDIGGNRRIDIAEQLGLGGNESSQTRSARRRCR